MADDVDTGHRTDVYGSDFTVFVSRTAYPAEPTRENILYSLRDSVRQRHEPVFDVKFLHVSGGWPRLRYGIQCEYFCKTLASTTMAGFSMSALL